MSYMKKPCEHCPFRKDIKPFLRAKRGEELAYHAQNPYNSFTCHKTTVPDEESEESEMLVTENSKECAGFLTLQIIENGEECKPKGFEPAYDIVFDGSADMADAFMVDDDELEDDMEDEDMGEDA